MVYVLISEIMFCISNDLSFSKKRDNIFVFNIYNMTVNDELFIEIISARSLELNVLYSWLPLEKKCALLSLTS